MWFLYVISVMDLVWSIYTKEKSIDGTLQLRFNYYYYQLFTITEFCINYKKRLLTACSIAFECRLDSMSSAVRLCSATSMHVMACSLSRKAGTASATAPLLRGSASNMYVSARQAWFICKITILAWNLSQTILFIRPIIFDNILYHIKIVFSSKQVDERRYDLSYRETGKRVLITHY